MVNVKPPTIEERAKEIGFETAQIPEWSIWRNGELQRTFPSRREISKWLNGAEAMHRIMSAQIADFREERDQKRELANWWMSRALENHDLRNALIAYQKWYDEREGCDSSECGAEMLVDEYLRARAAHELGTF